MKLYSSISILPCGHQFHSICYNHYRGYVCPMCRVPNMKKRVDTIMLNDKNLFEWTDIDFSSYMKFINEKKHIIEFKKKELKKQLEEEKKIHLNDCIKRFYFKNLNQIRYNLLKNITNYNKEFSVLYCRFGDVYEEYPIIFLLKGPKKDNEQTPGVDYLLQVVQKNFSSFSFYVKNNRGSMCYELMAKLKDRVSDCVVSSITF